MNCLKLLRSSLGDQRFYAGLIGHNDSLSLSPLSLASKRVLDGHIQGKCNVYNTRQILDLFFEVEHCIHSNKRASLALPTGRFTVDNRSWVERSSQLKRIMENCIYIQRQHEDSFGQSLHKTEIEAARKYLHFNDNYWGMMGELLEFQYFSVNVQILFKSEPERWLNYIADMMFFVKDSCLSTRGSRAKNDWSTFVRQYTVSSVLSGVEKLREEMLRFKSEFSYERTSVNLHTGPFLEKSEWAHCKHSLFSMNMDGMNIELFCSNDPKIIRRTLKYATRVQAAKFILILWLYWVVKHDEFFYADWNENHVDISRRAAALSFVFATVVQERVEIITDYHNDLDRSDVTIPLSSLSIALQSLAQIFLEGYSDASEVYQVQDAYNKLLREADNKFSLKDNMNVDVSENDNIDVELDVEDYVILLIQRMSLAYFPNHDGEGDYPLFNSLGDESVESALKILCMILIPLIRRGFWGAASLTLRKILSSHRRMCLISTKQRLYRLCTNMIVEPCQTDSSFISVPSIKIESPVDFAVANKKIEFLELFYSLFPESRKETDVVRAVVGSKNDVVRGVDMSFLLFTYYTSRL